MARIDNDQQNEQARLYMVKRSFHNALIGLTVHPDGSSPGNPSNWRWIVGPTQTAPAPYAKWDTSYPVSTANAICVRIDDATTGEWRNVACDPAATDFAA